MNHDNHDDKVRVETELEASPEKVWRALTVSEFVSRWLMPNDIEAKDGHAFSLQAAESAIECRIIEANPPELLSYSWREKGGPDSLVSFRLTATETGGTRLTIVHSGLARPALPTLRIAGVSGTRMSLVSSRFAHSTNAANRPTLALAA
jgi:uncharacterized protein YndB with AHSA1/START domain